MAQNLLRNEDKTRRKKMDCHVLCIDDDPEFLTGIRFEIEKLCRCSTVTNLRDGLETIQKEAVDLVLLDVGLGDEDGIEGLRQIKRIEPGIDVVMVSGHRDPGLIVSAIRAGASDYICKPFEPDDIAATIEKSKQLQQMRNRHDALLSDLKAADPKSRILGVSRAFRDLLDKADRLKGYNANILIEGESGTGKELIAKYVHNLENNPRRPFIAVNCAAIPDTLIESELFGHEKGSFTGAVSRKIGKFELADGGDIFLDEISALKPELQAKILRTLQEKEICRVGGHAQIGTNFRVISATNDDLEGMVARGEFRMDLFHRLRVVHLCIPPLRERAEDIPILVKHFLDKHSKPGHHKEVAPKVIEFFKNYAWPGNIRELENLVHNLIIMAPNGTIEVKDIPEWVKIGAGKHAMRSAQTACDYETLSLKECLKRLEKDYIERMLQKTEGNKSKAAAKLGFSRTTLHAKLRELGIG